MVMLNCECVDMQNVNALLLLCVVYIFVISLCDICKRMAGILELDIIITIQSSLATFKHMEQKVRELFAQHEHQVDILNNLGTSELPIFSQPKALGPRPLLEL
jgi:hypothetical protein